MQIFRTMILATIVAGLASCATMEQPEESNDTVSRMLNEMKANPRAVPPVADPRDARIAALEKQIADLVEAANQRTADLEKQLADREREMAALQAEQSAEREKLKVAERGVVKGLRPQIEKGDITVDGNSERLLIHLASGYLFGTGEDELKPEGREALKRVGAVLKDFPQYKVWVDGHTDNVPIHGTLRSRFPTNKELSEARAVSASKALSEGGRANALATGYGDTKPVGPNTTAEGRAMNRRVEVRVTR